MPVGGRAKPSPEHRRPGRGLPWSSTGAAGDVPRPARRRPHGPRRDPVERRGRTGRRARAKDGAQQSNVRSPATAACQDWPAGYRRHRSTATAGPVPLGAAWTAIRGLRAGLARPPISRPARRPMPLPIHVGRGPAHVRKWFTTARISSRPASGILNIDKVPAITTREARVHAGDPLGRDHQHQQHRDLLAQRQRDAIGLRDEHRTRRSCTSSSRRG